MKLKAFLQAFGLVAIIFTLIPFIAADYWWIRVFDFPHTQLTILTMVALLTYFIKFDLKSKEDYIFAIVLGACFTYQLLKIYPYIPHGNHELMDASPENGDLEIKFYIANVLQDNDNPNILIQEIKNRDADILLFMETNNRWMKDIQPAVTAYHHR